MQSIVSTLSKYDADRGRRPSRLRSKGVDRTHDGCVASANQDLVRLIWLRKRQSVTWNKGGVQSQDRRFTRLIQTNIHEPPVGVEGARPRKGHKRGETPMLPNEVACGGVKGGVTGVSPIHHPDVSMAVEGDACRSTQFSGPFPRTAQDAQIGSATSEDAHLGCLPVQHDGLVSEAELHISHLTEDVRAVAFECPDSEPLVEFPRTCVR